MPRVIDQALPSEVQSAVGSEWKESPVIRLSAVCPQVVPPFEEKKIAWVPAELMAFEAARIWAGALGLMAMADSLRAVVWAPERRRLAPAVATLPPGISKASGG